MERSIEELIKAAHSDPENGLPLLAAASREAIATNDAKRAGLLVKVLLSLSVERRLTDAGHRDLVDWLLSQPTSLQIVLWAAIFARMVGDLSLEQRALSLAPTTPLAN